MWELLRQRWCVLPNDWKLAFVVLILSSVIFPAVWQVRKVPNIIYAHVLIKLHWARTKWFAIHGGQTAPSEDEIIKLSGVWPWLAKRALRLQQERCVTDGFN
jgi:hypothetical protein